MMAIANISTMLSLCGPLAGSATSTAVNSPTYSPRISTVSIATQFNSFGVGKALSSSLKLEPFADLFIGSRHCMCTMYIYIYRRRGGHFPVDLSLFVFLYV